MYSHFFEVYWWRNKWIIVLEKGTGQVIHSCLAFWRSYSKIGKQFLKANQVVFDFDTAFQSGDWILMLLFQKATNNTIPFALVVLTRGSVHEWQQQFIF